MPLGAMHCQHYLGRTVIVHSHYGVHHGVMREIRRDGIVLANVRAVPVSGELQQTLRIEHADQPDELSAETAFFPFFFIPFLALTAVAAAAASPWWWY